MHLSFECWFAMRHGQLPFSESLPLWTENETLFFKALLFIESALKNPAINREVLRDMRR